MITTAIFEPACETRIPMVAVSAYAGATEEMPRTTLPTTPMELCDNPLS